MYDRILVATDGGEATGAIVDEAIGLARLAGATLHVVYVVDTRDYNTLPETKWLSIDEELTRQGREVVDAVADEAADAGVPVETAVETGIPHQAIHDYVAAHDVDLIVMGTHGRSGLDHFLIGSVAEKVLRTATVPVHVVRLGGGADAAGD